MRYCQCVEVVSQAESASDRRDQGPKGCEVIGAARSSDSGGRAVVATGSSESSSGKYDHPFW